MQTIQKHVNVIKAGVASLLLCLVLGLPALAFAEPETSNDAGDASAQAASIETAANMVTVPATFIKTPSMQSTHLSATVSYNQAFTKGEPTRFTFNVSGNTGSLRYKVFSFELETEDGPSYVVDPSSGAAAPYRDENYIDVSLYAPGKYTLIFTPWEWTENADGEIVYGDLVRFQIEFTISESDSFKGIDAIVSEVAQQCNAACGDSDDYTKALWLNDWILDNTEYDYSGTYCSAESVLGQGLGTCEGYHGAYVKLLNKVGIETRRVDSSGDNHVWTGAKLDGKWYNIDTTWNDYQQLGDNYPDSRHLYFAIPTSVMSLVHTKWDGNYSVASEQRSAFDANAYEDNYFIRSGEIDRYTKPYIEDVSGSYSVKSQLAAQKTSFSLPIVHTEWAGTNDKNVIYNLVAYQLGQERCWGSQTRVAANYANDTLNFTATYNNKPSIASATVTGVTDQTYASKKIEQNPKVVVDGKTLVEGRDYTLSYSNNVNASTTNNPAVMTITGIGDYCESKTVTFTIKQAKLSETTVDVFPTIVYNGQAQKPTPTVRAGDGVLSSDNYTVSYQNNVNAGDRTATVIIKAKGSNCTGEKRVVFTISPKALPKPTVSSSNIVYNGKAQEPVVVKDGTKTLVKGTDYTIKYTNNTNVGTAKAVVTGKGNYKGSQTITFQIRSSSGSSNSSGSSTGSSSGTNVGSSSTALTPAGNSSTISQAAPKSSAVTGTWKKSKGKWWFAYDSKTKAAQKRSYPANEWVTIKGKRYHFDANGYMHAKWFKSGSSWYWLGSDGAMRTGWQKVSGKWYFMESNGIMQTGKRKIGGQVYFLNASSGAMKTGWNKESDGWHYYKSSGVMAKGWTKVKGKWYYLNPSNGIMKTGFYDVNGVRYYSNSSGAMLTGWQSIGGKWYNFSKSGAMQKSKWIGDYYVDAKGVMATNTWIGKYHVNASGKWDKTR